MEDALLETVNLFPSAMQYHDISYGRIIVGDLEFSTTNFREAQWKLKADIKVRGETDWFCGNPLS